MSDFVDLPPGDLGVTGAAQSSADIREALICRPLTAVERAADDYADEVRERKAAWHAMWLAELSPKERLRLGINVNFSPVPKLPAQTDAERELANWRNNGGRK